jgi:hypothetical protein
MGLLASKAALVGKPGVDDVRGVRRLLLLVLLGLASCGGRVTGTHGGGGVSGAGGSSGSGGASGAGGTVGVGGTSGAGGSVGVGGSLGAGGASGSGGTSGSTNDASAECPEGRCVLCKDGDWHCEGKIYPPCPPGFTTLSCGASCPTPSCIFCSGGSVTALGCTSTGHCTVASFPSSCSP